MNENKNTDTKEALTGEPFSSGLPLYKAKRTDNGEWVEGYIIRYGFTGKEKWYIVPHYASDLYAFEINMETACRYIYMDKNSRKIWEHDIIKYHFGNETAEIKYGAYQSCFDSAKTRHIGFFVDWVDDVNLRKDLGYWTDMVECEIIGNSIDNPELIKERKYK